MEFSRVTFWWFWGVQFGLLLTEGPLGAAPLALTLPLVVVPLLLASVTSFARREWYGRHRRAIQAPVLGAGIALFVRSATDAVRSIVILDQYVRENRPDNWHSMERIITRTALEVHTFRDAILVVLIGGLCLGLVDYIFDEREPAPPVA